MTTTQKRGKQKPQPKPQAKVKAAPKRKARPKAKPRPAPLAQDQPPLFALHGKLPLRCPVVLWLANEGKSQRWLARRMGIKGNTLWRWLHRPGRFHCPPKRAVQMARLSRGAVPLEFLNRWLRVRRQEWEQARAAKAAGKTRAAA